MKNFYSVLVLVCLFTFLNLPFANASKEKPIYVVKFSDYQEGSIDNWLIKKGFEFKRDAVNRRKIDFDMNSIGLVIEAKAKSLGIIPNESVNLSEFSFIEIDWGVNKQPSGASYEKGIRNEAIMVIIFMGDERLSSGSLFIPDSTYFVGLFLCSGDDKIDFPYVGKYFKKGGRYVCLNRPKMGELATTRFDLLKSYRKYFDKENDDDPGISGIAITLDTQKASDKGTSSAFIREVRFYK